MTRTALLGITAGATLVLGAGGWAAADALRPAHTSGDAPRGALQVRYEIRREPAYAPPPPTEATRLEVMSTAPATAIEDGVLSAQAAAALRSIQAEDAARTAAALADVRAEEARIDRETQAALRAGREGDGAPAPSEPASDD